MATVVLVALACSCEAWRVPAASALVTARRSQRAAVLVSSEDGEVPPTEAEVEAPPKPKGSGQGAMPTDFLGFLDVNTGPGSLAASVIVAGGFCTLVELVKFVDKSPSTASVFGSLWS